MDILILATQGVMNSKATAPLDAVKGSIRVEAIGLPEKHLEHNDSI